MMEEEGEITYFHRTLQKEEGGGGWRDRCKMKEDDREITYFYIGRCKMKKEGEITYFHRTLQNKDGGGGQRDYIFP